MVNFISILGSTGSIGQQALDVARKLDIKVIALSAKSNIDLLEKQIREFKPKFAVVFDCMKATELKKNVNDLEIKILEGMEGLIEIASINKCDTVLNSLTGMIGLEPTIKALESGNNVAIANKESLVVGGEMVIKTAKNKNVKIFPVDSEHSAVFQCLQGEHNNKSIKNIILTASGGPFFGMSREALKNVTLDRALKHPNWNMGPKITIDCATMMNKGLEIIEATHLFNVKEDKIKVLIHRESIIHSMVEYNDNSFIAQLGVPDMRIPIQYAFTYPKKVESCAEELDLTKKPLTFCEPDANGLKCMDLCRKAIKVGGNMPTVLNAANEEAVKYFLGGRIKFLEIEQLVENAINNIPVFKISQISDIIDTDLKTRNYIKDII